MAREREYHWHLVLLVQVMRAGWLRAGIVEIESGRGMGLGRDERKLTGGHTCSVDSVCVRIVCLQVVRWSALVGGVGYGIFRLRLLQSRQDKLVAKQKAEQAAAAQSQTTSLKMH